MNDPATAGTIEPAAGQALFQNLVEEYLVPEMERRLADGELAPDTRIYRFQVLRPGRGRSIVRLNDEVTGKLSIKPLGYEPRSEEAEEPQLAAFLHEGRWTLALNLAAGHPRRTEFLSRAREFVATARGAARAQRFAAFVENAYAASELLATAELLSSQPTVDLVLNRRSRRSHSVVSTPYSAWAKLGNTDERFVRLLKRLRELRGPARYLDRHFALERDSVKELLRVLLAMEAHVIAVVSAKAIGNQFQAQTFIAKRPLRAGQLVTTDDVTIFPPGKPKPQ